jgi:glycosyltransferase involved in cell wall biosynthesis
MGASSRLRTYQYLPYLQKNGVEVVIDALLDERYLRRLYSGRRRSYSAIANAYWRRIKALARCYRYDLIWIEKEVFPWLPAFAERLLNLLRVPYVVDYDDATFHAYDRNRRVWIRKLLGEKIHLVMRNAAVVTVGNSYLAEHATLAGARKVVVIPTVVDMAAYNAPEAPPSEEFVIGWIGTPKTAHYLHLIAPALRLVCAERNARIVLVGAGDIELDGVTVDLVDWSEESEVSEIQAFDVGIMPLLDEPWERGKCGYKLIQYMACGKPVVASSVGVNSDLVTDGVNGYIAGSPQEWADVLRALASDPAKGIEMGQRGRAKVSGRYSLEATSPRLLSVLLEATHADSGRTRQARRL